MSETGPLVAIHQPEYFPWLGFLDKARRVDALVLLDNVQFDRSSLQHRAKVLGPNGVVWMTIPFVHRFPQRIDEVSFADRRWVTKHQKTIQACYGRAPGYEHARQQLGEFFAKPRETLVEAAIDSVELLLDAFRVRPTRLLRASGLKARGEKGDLVLAICQELGARAYLAGKTGAAYLDSATFGRAGVDIVVQQFIPKSYPRLRPIAEGEARGLSALDAWMNVGATAPDLLSTIGEGDESPRGRCAS